eukprot:5458590-Pleurochrysis_carterae.AAC.1
MRVSARVLALASKQMRANDGCVLSDLERMRRAGRRAGWGAAFLSVRACACACARACDFPWRARDFPGRARKHAWARASWRSSSPSGRATWRGGASAWVWPAQILEARTRQTDLARPPDATAAYPAARRGGGHVRA